MSDDHSPIEPLKDAFNDGRGVAPPSDIDVFNAAVTFLTGTPAQVDTSSTNGAVVSFSTDQFRQIAEVLMLAATQEQVAGLVNAERTGGRITLRHVKDGVFEIERQ